MTAMHASAALRSDMFSGTSLNTVIGATGKLRIYSGTPPANADTALSSNTLLAELSLAATAIASVSSGTATFGTITSATASATATATFWRVYDSAGTPLCALQGDVTTSGGGGDMIIGTTSIVSGATVSVSSATVSVPA